MLFSSQVTMSEEEHCIRIVNAGCAEGSDHDAVHFSLWFGRKLYPLGAYGCLVRKFNHMFAKAFAEIDCNSYCKIYVLLTDSRNITIPQMKKSKLTGEIFVRSCYSEFLHDIKLGHVWLVRCLYQPGSFARNFPCLPGTCGHKFITDKDYDSLDLLMKPSSVTCCPVIEDCC